MRIAGAIGLLLACALTACDGPQSALDPAGRDAERIASLFWWMLAGAVVIWLGVVGLAARAATTGHTHDPVRTKLLVIGGGTALPTVALAVLLVGGLSQMPALLEPGPEGGIRIEVSGEQYWWRVRYHLPDGRTVETANVLWLPLGRRLSIEVTSPDVIHSFWIPPLAGKIDAIPGRVNHVAVEPTRVGTYHGVCAEFCGPSHAHMELRAGVGPPEAFEGWLRSEARDARPAAPGLDLFLATGCGACHTIRGTPATGAIGPDLTHVGSRPLPGLEAGGDVDVLRAWLVAPGRLKPGAHMPAFGMLPAEELDRLARFLEGLR